MPTTNLLDIDLIETGDTTGAVDKLEDGFNAVDAGIEGAVRSLCDADMNGIISGWTISAGTGLQVVVAAGKGMIRGIYCESLTAIDIDDLPASEATIYIFAHHGTLPNGTKTVTFTASVSPSPDSDAMEIARCTTDGDSVTAVDNDSDGRAPIVIGTGQRREDFDLVAEDADYQLTRTPREGALLLVYLNGTLLRENTDFTISTDTVTLLLSIVNDPPEGSYISVIYTARG